MFDSVITFSQVLSWKSSSLHAPQEEADVIFPRCLFLLVTECSAPSEATAAAGRRDVSSECEQTLCLLLAELQLGTACAHLDWCRSLLFMMALKKLRLEFVLDVWGAGLTPQCPPVPSHCAASPEGFNLEWMETDSEVKSAVSLLTGRSGTRSPSRVGLKEWGSGFSSLISLEHLELFLSK